MSTVYPTALVTSMSPAADSVRLSILVPARDEAPNLHAFLVACQQALAGRLAFEVIIVDDGSRDETPTLLASLRSTFPFLRVATHPVGRGIADALATASRMARGDICVFYPADLQFTPADIPALIYPIRAGRADIVTGRKVGAYEKAFVSGIYNTLSRALFAVNATDLNSVKAWRRSAMEGVPMRRDWHRYMVVMAAAQGARLASVPVRLFPRRAGQSKFTWRRIPIGVLDMVAVWFHLRFAAKPMVFFGLPGAALTAGGVVAGAVAVALRFGTHADVALLVSLVQVLILGGLLLFGFGFLGELIVAQAPSHASSADRRVADHETP